MIRVKLTTTRDFGRHVSRFWYTAKIPKEIKVKFLVEYTTRGGYELLLLDTGRKYPLTLGVFGVWGQAELAMHAYMEGVERLLADVKKS